MQLVKGAVRACLAAGILVFAAGMAGCAKKPQTVADPASLGPVKPGTPREFAVVAGDRVLFQTDSAELTPQAQATLRGQAKWLAQYPGYAVTIQGHADERGTREYNIALGARRATTVQRYLVGLGVPQGRLRTISYGKERPVAVCNDISCWSQNRRAITVLSQAPGS